MTDPARLLSGEADDFEKELLGSWNAEQPSEAGRASVLAMVGLGVGAATVAGTAAAATKAGAVAGGSIAPKAVAAGSAALLKWLAVGLVGVATAGAAVAYVRHQRQAVPATAASVSAPPAPVVMDSPPLPQVEAPSSGGAPSGAAEPVAPALHPSTPTRHASPTDRALGEQVASLDRARRALADGDASGALRQIADYEARFPRGTLFEEAEVLRVESLLAEGDRTAAARVGARFLSAHPESPHAARMRALLGSTPAP